MISMLGNAYGKLLVELALKFNKDSIKIFWVITLIDNSIGINKN